MKINSNFRSNTFNSRSRSLLGLILLILLGQTAHAQTKPTDGAVNIRLQSIESALFSDHQKTQTWWYSWLGAYGAGTFIQVAVYLQSSEIKTRQDMALGAATTLLGAAGQWISPFKPNGEYDAFQVMVEDSESDQKLKLAEAERLLEVWSLREKQALTWQYHLLPTSVNLASGVITWVGFKRTVWDGVLNFALNAAITEVQIWSQPRFAMRNYNRYCQTYLENETDLIPEQPIQFYFEAKPCGIGFRAVF